MSTPLCAKLKGQMRFKRSTNGYCVAEMAASFLFIIPLIFILLFAVVQLVNAYTINNVLVQAAGQAARQLAVLYPENPTLVQARGYQDSLVYNNIKYNGIIADQQQFDDAVFNMSSDPQTVTVTVHYRGGQYGLQPFPSCDVLGLGQNFQLSGTSVYKLESN